MDDFVVSLQDSTGAYRSFRRSASLKVEKTDPLAAHHAAARYDHRQEHSRPRGVPGDIEMRRLAGVVRGRPQSPGVLLSGTRAARSGEAAEPGHGFLADLQRRLLGPPLQHAHEDQRHQRRRVEPGLGLPAESRRRAGRRQLGDDQVDAAADQRRAVLHHARSRLGGRCADRARDLALPLEVVGRQSPRQSRRRGPRRVAVFRNAGRQPRLAEHQGRQRALAQADRRPEPVLLRIGRAP